MAATVSQNNSLEKVLPYRFENWGPQSLSDLSKYVELAVGGAWTQTQVFWPENFPWRHSGKASPNLLRPLYLHRRFHLGIPVPLGL